MPGLSTWNVQALDRGSGIEFESLRFFLDGKEHPGDYDPDRNRVFLDLEYLKIQPDPGPHHLEIHARDKAGNRSKTSVDFTIRPR